MQGSSGFSDPTHPQAADATRQRIRRAGFAAPHRPQAPPARPTPHAPPTLPISPPRGSGGDARKPWPFPTPPPTRHPPAPPAGTGADCVPRRQPIARSVHGGSLVWIRIPGNRDQDTPPWDRQASILPDGGGPGSGTLRSPPPAAHPIRDAPRAESPLGWTGAGPCSPLYSPPAIPHTGSGGTLFWIARLVIPRPHSMPVAARGVALNHAPPRTPTRSHPNLRFSRSNAISASFSPSASRLWH